MNHSRIKRLLGLGGSESRRLRRLLTAANLFAISVIAGVIIYEVANDRGRVIADATADAENLRDVLAEHTRQTFSALDTALLSIAETVDVTNLSSSQTYQALRVRQGVATSTYAMYVIDAEGRLAATSRSPWAEAVDMSNRPMFNAHRLDPDLDLRIAAPRMGELGYAMGRWIVNVSRRLYNADRSFAGVVAAAVSIEYLMNFYDALRVGKDGVVGMLRDDATVIARSPRDPSILGRELQSTVLFQNLLPYVDQGVYRAPFVTDGVERITAYKRVAGYPAVVYVGLSVEERLAPWYRRAVIDGFAGLIAIGMMGGILFLFLRRLDEREEESAARVERILELVEASSELIDCETVDEALRRSADLARHIVPCHQAMTRLTDVETYAQAVHSVSLSDKYARWRSYEGRPDGSGIYRLVCETNSPMRLTQVELEAHSAWRGFGDAKNDHPPMRGWLAVPLIRSDGGNLGLIQLSDRMDGEFSAEDEALMLELSQTVSIAIQKLRIDESRHAARREAEAAQHQIEAVFKTISDGVIALDDQWRFTFLNANAENLIERSAADLMGRKIWAALPDLRGSAIDDKLRQARRDGENVSVEFYHPQLNRWLDIRAFPHDKGITVYFRDITEPKDREAQLRQAQKMEAVGQLTGGIAHDFNNILTVILGNAQLLTDTLPADDPLHRRALQIAAAADRATALTSRLLAFSRRQPLAPKAVEINGLLTGIVSMIGQMIGEQYEVDFTPRDGLPNALVDASQLETTIINLAVNARDAMPEGGRLVIEVAETILNKDYLEDHPYAKPGRYLLIAVSDTGTGMAPEVRSRVFEPFFTTKKAGAGTGLGLSMVYGFIKQSNGHVDGASALNVLDKDKDFDLLLTDVILAGGMNGRQVADLAQERAPNLRVLFMSGYPEDIIVHDGRLDKGTDLLRKPFRRYDLAKKLRASLDRDT